MRFQFLNEEVLAGRIGGLLQTFRKIVAFFFIVVYAAYGFLIVEQSCFRSVRTDILHIRPAPGDDGKERGEDVFRRLPGSIVPGITPGAVGHVDGFPDTVDVAERNLGITMRFVIAESISHPAGNQGPGLIPMHDLDQFPGIFFRDAAGHVKPDQFKIAVVRRDFLYLWQALFAEIIIE